MCPLRNDRRPSPGKKFATIITYVCALQVLREHGATVPDIQGVV